MPIPFMAAGEEEGEEEEEGEAALGRGDIGEGSDDDDEFLRVRTRDVFSIGRNPGDQDGASDGLQQQEQAGPQPWDDPVGTIGTAGGSSLGKKKKIKIKTGKVGTIVYRVYV